MTHNLTPEEKKRMDDERAKRKRIRAINEKKRIAKKKSRSGLSPKDRQELADVRHEKAGLQPILLEDLREVPQFRKRRREEIEAGIGEMTIQDQQLKLEKETKDREEAELITGGFDPLIKTLEEKTLRPLDISPTIGAVEIGARAGLTAGEFVNKLFGIETPEGFVEDFAKTGAGKVVGGIGLVGLALGFVGLVMGGKALATGIGGKGLGSATGVVASIVGIQKISDFKGPEIAKITNELSTIESTASSLASGSSAGADPNYTLEVLLKMDSELNEAEIRLQELGELNIDWRVTKEYTELQKKIRNTRTNLLERARTSRNLAITGTATATPQTYFEWFDEVEQNNPQAIKDFIGPKKLK